MVDDRDPYFSSVRFVLDRRERGTDTRDGGRDA
jgi:hypothetical protein